MQNACRCMRPAAKEKHTHQRRACSSDENGLCDRISRRLPFYLPAVRILAADFVFGTLGSPDACGSGLAVIQQAIENVLVHRQAYGRAALPGGKVSRIGKRQLVQAVLRGGEQGLAAQNRIREIPQDARVRGRRFLRRPFRVILPVSLPA